MMSVKLCEICGIGKATVPDRNRGGRLINRVCSDCHSLRLRGDLIRIAEIQKQRRDSTTTKESGNNE